MEKHVGKDWEKKEGSQRVLKGREKGGCSRRPGEPGKVNPKEMTPREDGGTPPRSFKKTYLSLKSSRREDIETQEVEGEKDPNR